MSIYKTIETKNGSYDISKIGNLFSVEIAGDELIFDTEEEAIAAINEDANYQTIIFFIVGGNYYEISCI